jgi:hypothetical protein
VLKEQDLEKTLSVLRTELVERHQDLTSQASDLPQTSFRPSVAAGTLSLAVHLPLLGRTRDLHPLDYAHVGRTKKKRNLYDSASVVLELMKISGQFVLRIMPAASSLARRRSVR